MEEELERQRPTLLVATSLHQIHWEVDLMELLEVVLSALMLLSLQWMASYHLSKLSEHLAMMHEARNKMSGS